MVVHRDWQLSGCIFFSRHFPFSSNSEADSTSIPYKRILNFFPGNSFGKSFQAPFRSLILSRSLKALLLRGTLLKEHELPRQVFRFDIILRNADHKDSRGTGSEYWPSCRVYLPQTRSQVRPGLSGNEGEDCVSTYVTQVTRIGGFPRRMNNRWWIASEAFTRSARALLRCFRADYGSSSPKEPRPLPPPTFTFKIKSYEFTTYFRSFVLPLLLSERNFHTRHFTFSHSA